MEKKDVEGQVASLQAKLSVRSFCVAFPTPRLIFINPAQSMQAEDAKLRTKATAARQKSDEAKASHSASRSQGNVLSSLTKLKEQGRLAGFHVRSSLSSVRAPC